jgi:hypothetical protein
MISSRQAALLQALGVVLTGLAGRALIDKLLALRGGAELVAHWAQITSLADTISGVTLAGIGVGLTGLVAAKSPCDQRRLLGDGLRLGLLVSGACLAACALLIAGGGAAPSAASAVLASPTGAACRLADGGPRPAVLLAAGARPTGAGHAAGRNAAGNTGGRVGTRRRRRRAADTAGRASGNRAHADTADPVPGWVVAFLADSGTRATALHLCQPCHWHSESAGDSLRPATHRRHDLLGNCWRGAGAMAQQRMDHRHCRRADSGPLPAAPGGRPRGSGVSTGTARLRNARGGTRPAGAWPAMAAAAASARPALPCRFAGDAARCAALLRRRCAAHGIVDLSVRTVRARRRARRDAGRISLAAAVRPAALAVARQNDAADDRAVLDPVLCRLRHFQCTGITLHTGIRGWRGRATSA